METPSDIEDVKKPPKISMPLGKSSVPQILQIDEKAERELEYLNGNFSLSLEARACLQNIRTITGFGSYREYLSYHEKEYPNLKPLLKAFNSIGHMTPRRGPSWPGLVLNLGIDQVHSINQCRRSDVRGIEIIEALCNPPKHVHTQIVLWNISDVQLLAAQRDLTDYLGLRLKLSPHFFEAVMSCVGKEHSTRFGWESGLDSCHSSHFTCRSVVANIYNPKPMEGKSKDGECTIILLAGSVENYFKILRYGGDIGQLRQAPPFYRSLSKIDFLDADQPSHVYALLLDQILQDAKHTHCDPSMPSAIYLLPLLQVQSLKLKKALPRSQGLLQEHRAHQIGNIERNALLERQLYDDHTDLRTLTDETETILCNFASYMKSEHRFVWFNHQLFRDSEEDFNQIIAEARRLESQIRDYLQLEAGKLGLEAARLSLEESRKSIEMSNKQIEEAKRVKIFTILAFVYVPLNLATSIYGMNLQQLNGNGRSLTDFVLTAVTALLVTGGTWFFIEEINSYRHWQRQSLAHDRDGKAIAHIKSSCTIAERVAMIVWLVRNGHESWTSISGAWWRILLNNGKHILLDADTGLEKMSAAAYVSRYSRMNTNSMHEWRHHNPFSSFGFIDEKSGQQR